MTVYETILLLYQFQLDRVGLGGFEGVYLSGESVDLIVKSVDLIIKSVILGVVMSDSMLLFMRNCKQLISFSYGVLVDRLILLQHRFECSELGSGPFQLRVDLSDSSMVRLIFFQRHHFDPQIIIFHSESLYLLRYQCYPFFIRKYFLLIFL